MQFIPAIELVCNINSNFETRVITRKPVETYLSTDNVRNAWPTATIMNKDLILVDDTIKEVPVFKENIIKW